MRKAALKTLIPLQISLVLISCTAAPPVSTPVESSENSGHVVLETFVGEQVPSMHVDLLRWELLADSVIAISGKVLTTDNERIENVTVCLLDEDGGVLAREITSNADGVFAISSNNVKTSDHILLKHQDFKTLDLVIKDLKNSNEGMLVKYERVILP